MEGEEVRSGSRLGVRVGHFHVPESRGRGGGVESRRFDPGRASHRHAGGGDVRLAGLFQFEGQVAGKVGAGDVGHIDIRKIRTVVG
jgi:hypothetical protein